MKNKILYFFALLTALTGCDKTPEGMPDRDADKAIVLISLNTDSLPGVGLNDAHLYWFDETDSLCLHNYYGSMQELAQNYTLLPKKSYTVTAVANAGKEFTVSPEISLAAFSKHLREQAEAYPDMVCGTLRLVVKEDQQLAYIKLAANDETNTEAECNLLLSIPSPRLPDFTGTKTGSTLALRGVAHIFKKGDSELFVTKRAMLTPTDEEGVYSMNLVLPKGEYSVNLWVDYTKDADTDNHYITTDPNQVSIPGKEDYTANSDTHDGFEKRIALTVDEDIQTEQIEMHRPLAKYRIVATDIEKYLQKRAERPELPAWEELRIFIGYEGFLPTTYSITESKPADAAEGYCYYSAWGEQEEPGKATVAKDYVFVNNPESSVYVTILF